MSFKLLVVTVKNDLTEYIVAAAKKAGASGSTVIPARGTGVVEAKTFFGLNLSVASDVIFFLLEEQKVSVILEAVRVAGEFERPGTGVAFVLDVGQVTGLNLSK